MKMMISQPMGGKSEEEIRKDREFAVNCIIKSGNEHVESIINEEPNTKNIGLWYLGRSFEIMSNCDGVLFIGNWEKYRGCQLEYLACQAYGIPTFLLTETEEMWVIEEFTLDFDGSFMSAVKKIDDLISGGDEE